MRTEFDFLAISCIACIMAAAAFIDLRSQRIPNRLTYSTMVFMLAYYGMAYGLDGLWFSTKGLLLGTGILLPVYLIGGMGAGDAKLMGAAGAALGMQGVFTVFLFTALAGGLYALIILVFRYKQVQDLLARSSLMLKVMVYSQRIVYIPGTQDEHAPKLCYAIPIAIGTAGALAWHLAYSSYLI